MLSCLGKSHALVVSGGFPSESRTRILSDRSSSLGLFVSCYPFGAFYLVALFRLCVHPRALNSRTPTRGQQAHLSDRSGGAPGRSTEWSQRRDNCMSNTLDSVQIEPSCLDVGFGEVLHAALASLWRRKLLVGAIVAAALALGIIAVFVTPRSYKSEASIRGGFVFSSAVARDDRRSSGPFVALDLMRVLRYWGHPRSWNSRRLSQLHDGFHESTRSHTASNPQ